MVLKVFDTAYSWIRIFDSACNGKHPQSRSTRNSIQILKLFLN